jgi:hypothetical protein
VATVTSARPRPPFVIEYHPDAFLTRYYLAFNAFLGSNPFLDLGIGLVMILCAIISHFGDRGASREAYTALLWPLIPLLFLGYLKGSHDLAYPNGRYHVDVPSFLVDLFYSLLTLVYVPLFAVGHLMVPIGLVIALPSFVRGTHFLFVPHPAARHVSPALDTAGLADALEQGIHEMAPGFIHENMARKAVKMSKNLRAKEERLREEIKLADAALEHERARAAHRDAQARRGTA